MRRGSFYIGVCAAAFWSIPITSINASMVINEIMYDLPGSDTDREWIEIVNASGDVIDLSEWKFFEANTNHKLTLLQGEVTLSPGAYAVIVDNPEKFKNDWPGYSGTLFDSSFSLNNTGETISLRTPEFNDVGSITYTSNWGGKGDGNSIQRIDLSWHAASPTPGGINSNVSQTSPPSSPSQESRELTPPSQNLYSAPPPQTQEQTTVKSSDSPETSGTQTTGINPISLPKNTPPASSVRPSSASPEAPKKELASLAPTEDAYTEGEKFDSIAAVSIPTPVSSSTPEQRDFLTLTLLALAGIIGLPLIALVLLGGRKNKDKITIVE